jgi:hypothetical protein
MEKIQHCSVRVTYWLPSARYDRALELVVGRGSSTNSAFIYQQQIVRFGAAI